MGLFLGNNKVNIDATTVNSFDIKRFIDGGGDEGY